jgi:hypothetical protein
MLMAAVTRLNTDSKLFQNYAVLYPLLSSLVATVGLVLVDVGCHIKGRWSKDIWERVLRKIRDIRESNMRLENVQCGEHNICSSKKKKSA